MDRIKNLREEKDLTQEDLANILGIKRPTYTSYEIERDTIPLKHLLKLCEYFDISLDYAFGFTNKLKYNQMSHQINMELIKKRLQETRKENNISQIKLAKVLNTSRSTWTNYERGIHLISTLILYDFSRRYETSADYLLGKCDNPIKFEKSKEKSNNK